MPILRPQRRAAPGPTMARVQVIEAPLVERELEEFERLRAAARRGEGAAALVEGPAGIGKTRLLAAARASAEDLEVLRARASEPERDFPFGVARQLFEPVSSRPARRDEAGSWPAPAGSPSVCSRAQRYQTEGVVAIRSRYCTASTGLPPIWPARVPFCCWSTPGVRVIQPAALSGAGVAQLVERTLRATQDAAFVSACQQATAGNPFLVRELLAVLTAQGVPQRPTTRRSSGNSARAASGDRSAPACVGCPSPVSSSHDRSACSATAAS